MIIDCHFHLGCTPNFFYYDDTAEGCINYMDNLGISCCISAHFHGLVDNCFEKSIEMTKEAYQKSNGRIMGYYIFNPRFGEKCMDLIEMNSDRKIFKAVKIHPSFHETDADDSSYEIIWEYSQHSNIPIMSHSWSLSSYNPSQKYSFVPKFEHYIAKYAGVNFIFGHSGGRYDGIVRCVGLAGKYNNVYLDLSGDVYDYGLVEYLVRKLGSKKILFGSDGVMIDGQTQLGMVLGADITLEDKENILYRNAARIFAIK